MTTSRTSSRFWRRLLLAPLAGAYAAGTALHRTLWLRPLRPAPALPLIVIGSLRAGGAGKTSVAGELARWYRAQGKRVGILVYRLGGGAEETEVFFDSDWRASSDEALLLARQTDARVFATRDRAATWKRLADGGGFDVLISDDGLMDARLAGAFRIVLVRPEETPGWRDLMPAGPYHLTTSFLRKADLLLVGPTKEPTPAGTFTFDRRPVLPDDLDKSQAYWVLTGLGNPGALCEDLERAGVRVAGLTAGADHGLPDLARARRGARAAGAAGFLFTAKDAIKLAGRLREVESAFIAGERVSFSSGFPTEHLRRLMRP
jgi:tetraacyldisaccharide 4'-kinase